MCICVCMMRVYVHVHMSSMYIHIYVSVYMHAYTCVCTCVWMYICTLVGAFCLFVLSSPSTTCVCITGIFSSTCMRVLGDRKWDFLPACSWLALDAGVGVCFDTCRDTGFVLNISLFLWVLRWWVSVCLYTRVHTQTTWALDVSSVVGQTCGEPEGS